ncbi:PAS domain-containing protein [Halomicroarcula sp. GCM10025817]|uniref:PAS domain-containing protein n=1 Tax=Haloarcula TaxID=2237 RepID=UPI0023E85B55|nr:PAS domain-containing protein [Halomicroarcula sp. SYNS111]
MERPTHASSPGPVLVVQSDGRIDYVNTAARLLLGAPARDALVGESVLEYVAAAYRDPLRDQFDRLSRGAASAVGLTLTLDDPARGPCELVVLNSTVEWDGDERIEMLVFDTDEHLPTGLPKRVMDATPVGISIADADRDDEPLIYVNDGFCELTGYPREEVLGRNCRFLQGERTDETTVADIRDAIDAEVPVTAELRNYRKDGSMFWNRLTITPVEAPDGTVTHYFGFQEDVSDRRAFEQEKRLFEMQAEALNKAILITDTDGTIEYVNAAFERTTGYDAEEALGETPRILKSGHQDEDFYRDLWETITAGEIWEAEITNRRKSGELYRSTQKIIPVTDADGEITDFVAIEEDITDAQFIEQVLHVMDRVLRHNVRNSVTAIHGFTDLLEGELDDEEHRAAVGSIREHTEKLAKLSDETRTIRELFRRRHAEHSLAVAAVEGFVDTRREMHPGAVIEFSMDADDETVVQNGSLLQLAIDEAIENAIVHHDGETPRLAVAVEEADDGEAITIEVADTGPGIPDEEWDVIMSGEETSLQHGTGIGLWLMYWAVTALGGTMRRAENDPRGTVLTYHVPLVAGAPVDEWNPTE